MVFSAGSSLRADPIPFHMMPIRRLPPREFRELPRAVVQALESRGCTIPQTWLYDEPSDLHNYRHNVVGGSFRTKGRMDWAVLCSCRDSSSILVFWGGKAANPAEFGRARDEDWTQDVDGKGNLGYSRFIEVAHPDRILAPNPGFGAKAQMHDGLEESFLEKGSSIHYYQGGTWLMLDGSD
jgi:hypothetical protein